jgi:hypothetical protein
MTTKNTDGSHNSSSSSSSNSSNDDNNLLLSKIALLAQNGNSTIHGEKPSDEDLAMLFDDRLDFNRKQQVISHLNADPLLMQQWINLVEILGSEALESEFLISENVKVKEKQRFLTPLLNWFSSWQGVTGGLVAASLVVVVFLMQYPSPLTPNIDHQPQVATGTQTKQTDKNGIKNQFISPDKRAISAGIMAYLTAHNIEHFTGINLSHAIGQNGSSLAPTLYQHYFALGQIIAEQGVACMIKTKHLVIDKKQLAKMVQLIKKIKQTSFMPLPKSLANINEQQNLKQLCGQLNHFLSSI